MGDTVELPSAIEPSEWFVVFHRKGVGRIISALAVGEFKHVSAFGYCAGYKAWLVYDVQWRGTRVFLADKATIMALTDGCNVLKVPRSDRRMGMSSRAGLYCVSAVKHLLGLRCVAATPSQLYRFLLSHGGVPIHGAGQPARDDGRS